MALNWSGSVYIFKRTLDHNLSFSLVMRQTIFDRPTILIWCLFLIPITPNFLGRVVDSQLIKLILFFSPFSPIEIFAAHGHKPPRNSHALGVIIKDQSNSGLNDGLSSSHRQKISSLSAQLGANMV